MSSSQENTAESLSSVMMALQDRNLLLPANVIVETTSMSGLIVESRIQRWILGHKYWRNLRIPVISFEILADGGLKKHSESARIIVFGGQTDQEHIPFWGMLVQDIPRSVKITDQNLAISEENISEAEHIAVEFQGRYARIPDLGYVEEKLLSALGFTGNNGQENPKPGHPRGIG